MARRKAPSFPDALVDELLQGSDASSALGPGGLLEHLKKALAEHVLNAEMEDIFRLGLRARIAGRL